MHTQDRPPAPSAPAPAAPSVPRAVVPTPVPEGVGLDHPSLYFNRELSWLDFNWRVLAQARDPRVPLLERVRFVAITCANLDEFFQKRVGGLKQQDEAGVLTLSRDGRAPAEQLQLIRGAAGLMHQAMTETWERELRPLLRREAEVVVSDWSDLRAAQRAALGRYFREQIYPVLTPLAVDPGHPFPFISNLSLSLAVLMRHAARGTVHFARIKLPAGHPRLVRVEGGYARHHFVPLEQVIGANVGALFPGMEVESVAAFRLTRSAVIGRDEEGAEDLLEVISEELRERRFAPVVRLEVEHSMPAQVRELLVRELELRDADVYDCVGMIASADLTELADLDVPEHRFHPWEPVVPEPFQHEGETEEERNVFAIIGRGDVLLHHPYESFSASVQRLVEEAADDPDVLAIKQTLYRTGANSPIARALVRAAERGKQVAVLVEVSARFDEAANLQWAEALEDAGVHVTYGLVGLKTHAKVTLVVRYEEGRPRTYCHVGTGNYHARTARIYTDLGVMTCDPAVGFDMVNLFHFLTGYAPDQQYARLVVAPRDMRRVFEERIEREVALQRAGGQGRIVAKLNALDDEGIIQQLYAASQAGVRIDLVVRGHCRLRPGLPGYSENIRVRSIVGRFLEHDRVYCFGNGGAPEIFLGSADWRRRNLAERVEAMVPVTDPALRDRLVHVLQVALADNRLAWELGPDGTYVQRTPGPDEVEVDFQATMMAEALNRAHRGGRPWELREG